MFFEWSKRIWFGPRALRLFLFTAIFLFFSGSLYFLGLAITKKQLQQWTFVETESALAAYLKLNNHFRTVPIIHGHLPVVLDFVRIVKGDEQLLITGAEQFDVSRLVDLSPHTTGSWVDLLEPGKEGDWTLVSIALEGGGAAQGGRNVAQTDHAVYGVVLTAAKWVLLCAVLFSFLLAVGGVYLLELPLRKLEQSLTAARGGDCLKGGEGGVLLAPLLHILEQLFYQNRSLIHEMQSSLDNVAHDLRTPMTRLRAIAEYALQSDVDSPEPYREALSDCLEESERVVSMLGVMMSVAEAEAGTMRLELQRVNVLDAVNDVVALYQYVAEEAGVTIDCEGDETLFIEGDATRLSQVWANLLDNAIKYSKESGKVRVSVVLKVGNVCVSFADNGIGISETEIDRIWERLYRGDRSRTKQGLGLGLNYVKAVVEAHHGRVVVESTILEGSQFDVYLPLKREITDQRGVV